MEIATREMFNPIKQDTQNGRPREYYWGDMLVCGRSDTVSGLRAMRTQAPWLHKRTLLFPSFCLPSA